MSILKKITDLKKRFETPFETLNHIYISREAILHNFDLFQRLHPEWSVFPVLKSNAYGHGIREIAQILNDRKIEYIVVDSFFEALKVREVNLSPILLIGYTLPQNLKNIDFSLVSITVYDIDTLRTLSELPQTVKVHLKIDSGMHRQGLYNESLDEYLDIIRNSPNIILEGICTHFADADNPINETSFKQEKIFMESVRIVRSKGFAPAFIHADNSAASAKSFCDDFTNAQRLGISLYGVNPLEENDPNRSVLDDLRLALTFDSTLILTKHLRKGDMVSYNGTFVADSDMEIGIVPVGYYEGLSRKLSNNYAYYHDEESLDLLGRVCMNLTVVDITGKGLHTGDTVKIIGTDCNKTNNLYELSRRSETIPYECLVRLSETIRRRIV